MVALFRVFKKCLLRRMKRRSLFVISIVPILVMLVAASAVVAAENDTAHGRLDTSGTAGTTDTSSTGTTAATQNSRYLCNFTTSYIERRANDSSPSGQSSFNSSSSSHYRNDSFVVNDAASSFMRLSADGTTLVVRGPPIRIYDLVTVAKDKMGSNSVNSTTAVASSSYQWLERTSPLEQQQEQYQQWQLPFNSSGAFSYTGGDSVFSTSTHISAPPIATLATLSSQNSNHINGGSRAGTTHDVLIAVLQAMATTTVVANNTFHGETEESKVQRTQATLSSITVCEMHYPTVNDDGKRWTTSIVQEKADATNDDDNVSTATGLVDLVLIDAIVALESNGDGTIMVLSDISGMVQVWQRSSSPSVHVDRNSTVANGTEWEPMGQSLYTTPGGKQGLSSSQHLALSSNGTILAIGDATLQAVTVYHYSNDRQIWMVRGQGIFGYEPFYGQAIALSASGDTIAIGAAAPWNSSHNELLMGQVEVYDYVDMSDFTGDDGGGDGTTTEGYWLPKGEILHGTSAGENFGYSVALSSNGQVLAVGASGSHDRADRDANRTTTDGNRDSGTRVAGGVHVYVWSGLAWEEDPSVAFSTNQTLDDSLGQTFFSGVALSADGRTVAFDGPSADLMEIVRYDFCFDVNDETLAPWWKTDATVSPSSEWTAQPMDDDAPIFPVTESDGELTHVHDILVGLELSLVGVDRMLSDASAGNNSVSEVVSFQTMLAAFVDDFFNSTSSDADVDLASHVNRSSIVNELAWMQTKIVVTGQDVLHPIDDLGIAVNRITYVQTSSYETWVPTRTLDSNQFVQLPFQQQGSRDRLKHILMNSTILAFDSLQDIGNPIPIRTNEPVVPRSVADDGKDGFLDSDWGMVLGLATVAVIVIALAVLALVIAVARRKQLWNQSPKENALSVTENDDGATPSSLVEEPPLVSSPSSGPRSPLSPPLSPLPPLPPLEQPPAPISRIAYDNRSHDDDAYSSLSRISSCPTLEDRSLSLKSSFVPEWGGYHGHNRPSHRFHGRQRPRSLDSSLSRASSMTPQFATAVVRLDTDAASGFSNEDIVVAIAEPAFTILSDQELSDYPIPPPHYKDQIRDVYQVVASSSIETAVAREATTTSGTARILPQTPTPPPPLPPPILPSILTTAEECDENDSGDSDSVE